MQVKDGVEAVFGAPANRLFESCKAAFEVLKWFGITLEVAVVERQPHNGRALRFHKNDIIFGKEIIEKLKDKKLQKAAHTFNRMMRDTHVEEQKKWEGKSSR